MATQAKPEEAEEAEEATRALISPEGRASEFTVTVYSAGQAAPGATEQRETRGHAHPHHGWRGDGSRLNGLFRQRGHEGRRRSI